MFVIKEEDSYISVECARKRCALCPSLFKVRNHFNESCGCGAMIKKHQERRENVRKTDGRTDGQTDCWTYVRLVRISDI